MLLSAILPRIFKSSQNQVFKFVRHEYGQRKMYDTVALQHWSDRTNNIPINYPETLSHWPLVIGSSLLFSPADTTWVEMTTSKIL